MENAAGVFIANADGSILLATYGTISSETGDLDNGSWLVITYMLAVCAVQPTVSHVPNFNVRIRSQTLTHGGQSSMVN